jgi:hypothetical protein
MSSMSRRCLGVGISLIFFAGALPADDTKSSKDAKKNSKEITARVVNFDAAKNTLAVMVKDGGREEFTIAADTKVVDAKGHVVASGLGDKRLTSGAEIRLTVGADGKTIQEVRLSAKPQMQVQKTEPRESRQHQLRREERAQRQTPSLTGTVATVDAEKNTVLIRMTGKDGKEQDRTIQMGDGVKLTGPSRSGEQLKLSDLHEGSAVQIREKDGKVVEVTALPTDRSDKRPGKSR